MSYMIFYRTLINDSLINFLVIEMCQMYGALCTFLLPCGLAIVLRLPIVISLLCISLTMYQVAGSEYLIPYGLLIANIVVALRFVLHGRVAKAPSPPLFLVIVQDQRGWPSECSQAKALRVGRPHNSPVRPTL